MLCFLKNIFSGLKCPESKEQFGAAMAIVEKWSKIITFFITKVVLICGVFSRVIPSFIFYFFTDSGNEAFVLAVPMW